MPLNMPKKQKLLNPFIYEGLRSFYKFLFKIKVGNFSSGGEKTLRKSVVILSAFLAMSYDLFEEFLLLLFYCY